MIAEHREVSICKHEFKRTGSLCLHCGVYQHINKAVKTNKFETSCHLSHIKYIKHMKARQAKVVEGKQLNEDTAILLNAICDKFEFSSETLALGIYIHQLFQSLNPKQDNQRFWASACLIVAGKAIELDKKVPYLNRYQRYADKNHTQQEYATAEKLIFETLNFDVQFSTFISYLNFFMNCGVLFENDCVDAFQLHLIEDEIILQALRKLYKGNFSNLKPDKLASKIIKQTRELHKLKAWTHELETITGLKMEDFEDSQESLVLRQLPTMRNLSNKTFNNRLNDHKASNKQGTGSKLENLKENSFKVIQPHWPSKNTSLTMKLQHPQWNSGLSNMASNTKRNQM